MPRRSTLLLAALLIARPAGASDGFHPAGHVAEGLPADGTPVRAYAADPDSPLNALFTLLFQVERVPEEVGAALPTERQAGGEDDAAFYKPGWYFRKRPGVEADRVVVGGDVRTSPVQSLDPSDAARAIELLAMIATPEKVDAIPELRSPTARLLLQWDLWNALRRFEAEGGDPALLQALAKGVRACGQPAEVLRGLPSGTDELHARFASGRPQDRRAPYFPAGLLADDPGSPWVELDRASTKLFHGASSYRAARVFVNAGSRAASTALIESAKGTGAAGAGPARVPEGTEAAIVLSLIGLTPDLEPVATPMVDEVRVRALAGPRVLDPAGDTTSRDGLNTWMYLRTRNGTLVDPDRGAFRFVPDTAQSIFLEYGTAKRTTYAAQCTLCHRTTSDGGQVDAGFRSLGKYAKPRLAESPDVRFRLAEREVAHAVASLKGRLAE
ncbi:hypothetical protein [Paludisphaera soli]|uniref:hypothetical protein n=1 Tax=Paludisphaera soli TaxID=2712865 RepID=UPI0013EA15B4|nr:hypothetical protein [Paludisphaera soli]